MIRKRWGEGCELVMRRDGMWSLVGGEGRGDWCDGLIRRGIERSWSS